MASKLIIKKAIKNGRVQYALGLDNKLSKSVRNFFYQLRDNELNDDSNPSKLLPWAICSTNEAHIFKLSYNMTNKGKVGSFTTSQLGRHECFKVSLKSQSHLLNADEKRESTRILKAGATSAIIEDIKPFTLTSGRGMFKLIKSSIEVGVKLGRVPNDESINDIIPKRNAIKNGVKTEYNNYKIQKLNHFKKLDEEILPPFHTSFDFVTTDYQQKHILGVLAHEADRKNKRIETYVLDIMDWEDLCAEEAEGSSDQYYGDDESSSGYVSSEGSEESGDDSSCCTTEESVDNNFVYADWKDMDVDDGKSDDSDGSNADNNSIVGDDGNEEIKIKLKTSVTGDALEIQLDKLYTKNHLVNIGGSEDTHICGDRASENVKAGRQMTNKFVSGILHGYGTWIGGNMKKITSEYVRKRGQRIKRENPHYQPRLKSSLDQSKQFASKVKSRGLNDNFDPSQKRPNATRWNTEAIHLEPVVHRKNFRKICVIRQYWLENGKFKGKEKVHKYRDLIANRVLLKGLSKILSTVKSSYSLLEGEKYPIINKVIPVTSRLICGDEYIGAKGKRTTIKSILKISNNDEDEIKILKTLLLDDVKPKILDRLQLIHWEAVILCPATKNNLYFTDIFDGQFDRRDEAIVSIKRKLNDLAMKKSEKENENEENNNEEDDANDEEESKQPSICDFGFGDDAQNERSSYRLQALREFDDYLGSNFKSDIKNASWINCYHFWMDPAIESLYPLLSILAIWLLCIPASSAGVERLFSLLKNILTRKRGGRMGTDILCMLAELKKSKKFDD